MKKILPLFAIFIYCNFLFADIVPARIAKDVAANKLTEISFEYRNVSMEQEITWFHDSQPVMYIFNLLDQDGFVIISAEDNAMPILGYSFENDFDNANIPIQLSELLTNFEDQIQFIRQQRVSANREISDQWSHYSVSPDSFEAKISRAVVVPPLLGGIEWNQDGGWNADCPADESAPWYAEGHTFAGCVATSTGMIMKYHSYPLHGVGSNSYTPSSHPEYGLQSVNFSQATYSWGDMAENVASTEAAKLLYHIGVSVGMDYGPTGSSAVTAYAISSLKNYFAYKSSAQYVSKSGYSDADWMNLIKGELNNNRPCLYRGTGAQGGHAFVCDGYDSDNYFHFNWGWSGSYNGYYLLSSLTPNTYNFTDGQAAGIGIEPDFPSPVIEFIKNDVSCAGSSDGYIDITVSSGTIPYSYSWSNSQYTQDISGLSPGTYTVTVTDANSKTATQSILILDGSAISISSSVTNNYCFGGSDGAINITVSGGSPGYSYNWSSGPTTEDISSLTAGTYQVTVTDMKSCTGSDSFSVSEAISISATASYVNPSSEFATDGSIALIASGGSAPYTYIWTGGSTNDTLSNAGNGTFFVTITDALGCTFISQYALPNIRATKLTSTYCGQEVDPSSSVIANTISGASNYRFKFFNTGLAYSQTVERNLAYYKLSSVPGLLYGETYNVLVAAQVNGIWGEFGDTCQISIPASVPVTSIQSSYCGIELDPSTLIKATSYSGATGYRFNFSNTVLEYNQTVETSNFYYTLGDVPGILSGETYDVCVAMQISGEWGSYGDTCQISLPVDSSVTSLLPVYCGVQADPASFISAYSVFGATTYRFNFFNTGLGFDVNVDKTGSSIYLNTIPGLLYGQTYDVRVAMFLNGGWSEFGDTCQISLPDAPLSGIIPDFCGIEISPDSYIGAEEFYGAEYYRFNFSNVGLGFNQTVDIDNSKLYLYKVMGLQYGQTYDVCVAMKLNGVWGDYGDTCQVSLPASIPTTNLQASQCGIEVDPSVSVMATAVTGATNYRFNFSNPGLGYNQTVERNVHYYKLSNVPGLLYGQSYDVCVAMQINGEWGPWGDTCQISLPAVVPTTTIHPNYCGKEYQMSQVVIAKTVAGATLYKFNFVNVGLGYNQTIIKSAYYFRPENAPGLLNGETYDVCVAIKVNGAWGPFGDTCQISVAALKSMISMDVTEELLINDEPVSDVRLLAYPNPFNNSVTIETGVPDLYTFIVYDLTGRAIIRKDAIGEVVFDGSDFKSGIYFVQCLNTNTGKAETLRIIKAR